MDHNMYFVIVISKIGILAKLQSQEVIIKNSSIQYSNVHA